MEKEWCKLLSEPILRIASLITPVGKTIGDMYVIAKSNFDVQLRIDANTFRTANNTEPLIVIKKGY